MNNRIARWFVLCVCFAVPAAAQPTLSETLEVSIVNVDVFVTDKDGRRVRGLTKDDFELFENGERKPVTNFAEYASDAQTVSVTAQAPAQRRAEPAPPQRRTVVVFFERTKLPPHKINPFVDRLKDLLRETIRPGDVLSLVFWDTRGAAQVDAADDVDAAAEALDVLARRSSGVAGDDIDLLRREVADVMDFESTVQMLAAERGIPITPVSFEEVLERRSDSAMSKALLEMSRRVAAINATINSMSAEEGKKILLLATHRLGSVAGAEYAVTGGRAPNFEQKRKFGTEDLMASITANANAAGVTIYAMYPSGMSTNMPAADAPPPTQQGTTGPSYAIADTLALQNELASLENIARETGGLAAQGAEILDLLPRIEDDINDYYSLAYQIHGGRKDEARQIVVKMKNPAYKVRARRQYVDKTDTTRMRDRVVGALFRISEGMTIPITAELLPKSESMRLLRVRIPINALTVLEKGRGQHEGMFSLFVVSGARLEQVSEIVQKRQPFDIPNGDLEKARAGHFTYDLDLTVNAAAKRVAVAVFDEVGKGYGMVTLELTESRADLPSPAARPLPE